MKPRLFVTILLSACAAFSPAAPPQGGFPKAPRLESNLVYSEHQGVPLRLDLYQEGSPSGKQPLLIWVPMAGKEGAGQKPSASMAFPCPIAHYIGYHCTVVAMEFWNPASLERDVQDAVAFLTSKGKAQGIDTDRIGLIQPGTSGYTLKALKPQGRRAGTSMKLASTQELSNVDASGLTEAVLGFFSKRLGSIQESRFDPMSLRSPDEAWADPICVTDERTSYHLYPTPSRGAGTQGSYLLYLPKGYASSARRYPVLYYLHGGMGNQREGRWLIRILDEAMKAGRMPQAIIVSLQALPIGWYCNANVGAPGVSSGPVEDVIVRDLVPHIDASYRTIPEAAARGLEGWSMGGFGALRLAFKFPDIFGHASSLAGAVIDWEDEHNLQYLHNTFGSNEAGQPSGPKACFDAVHPRTWARKNAGKLQGHTDIRLLVGDQDWLYDNHGKPITRIFGEQLKALGIPYEYKVLPSVGHMLPQAFAAGQSAYPIEFWKKAFQAF